jgi:hypothetical protein
MNPVDSYLKEVEKLVGGSAYTVYDLVLKKCPFDKEGVLFKKQLLWHFYIYFGDVSLAKALEIEDLSSIAIDIIVHDECIKSLFSFRKEYGKQ